MVSEVSEGIGGYRTVSDLVRYRQIMAPQMLVSDSIGELVSEYRAVSDSIGQLVSEYRTRALRAELKSLHVIRGVSVCTLTLHELLRCEDLFTAEQVLHLFGALPHGPTQQNGVML